MEWRHVPFKPLLSSDDFLNQQLKMLANSRQQATTSLEIVRNSEEKITEAAAVLERTRSILSDR